MTFSARATAGNYQHIAAQSELNQVYQYCRGRGSLKVFGSVRSSRGHNVYLSAWHKVHFEIGEKYFMKIIQNHTHRRLSILSQ